MKDFVLITGIGSGIGKATAKYFADHDYNVIGTYLNGQDVSEFEDYVNVHVVEVDITKEEDVVKCYELTKDLIADEGLSMLINNAGIADLGSGFLEGVPEKNLEFCYEVNVFGTIRMIKKFLPLLRAYGTSRIINLSSGAVRASVPFSSVYNSTKYAVLGITKTLRYELAPFGIQVSCVEPSTVKSEMTDGHKENMDKSWNRMESDYVSLYKQSIAPTNEWLDEQIKVAIEPIEIAKKIYKLKHKRKLKIRYGGGQMASVLGSMEGILGENLLEKMLMKIFKVPKNMFIK